MDPMITEVASTTIVEHAQSSTQGSITAANPFILDEPVMRSLQQFMASQGIHPSTGCSDPVFTMATPIDKQNVPRMLTPRGPSLVEGFAQHYIQSHPKKDETEEEKYARAERIRQENRERKKKWRQANADRSALLFLNIC